MMYHVIECAERRVDMIGKTYLIVVFGILVAKALGFSRDIFFASSFGANEYTDMYFQIFGLVNLVFTGIGVALSTLIIKNVNKIDSDDFESRKKYISSFITRTTMISLLVTAVLYIFSGHIVKLLLPGLDDSLYAVATKLMYIMLPSLLFVLIAYIISGVLQNSGVFFVTSIMSLPFNVAIMASLFIPDVSIITVSVVTTIGWFLHIAIQLPSFYKKGYRLFSFNRGISHGGGNAEVLYIFISNMMFQLCFTIDKAFVTAQSGAASTINYASNLFITISSVFVVAMSNVVFPSISRSYEEGNREYVKNLTQYIIKVMIAIFLPFVLVVCCYGKDIISLLYERGEFTAELSKTTAVLFAIYSLGFTGYLCQELFNKLLYLDGRYKCTVIGAIVVVLLKPLINLLMADHGGVYAVAASTTVLLTLYAINVAINLKKVMGSYIDKALAADLAKLILAGVGALLAYFGMKFFAPGLGFIPGIALCGIVYIAILAACGSLKMIISGFTGFKNK